MVGPSPLCCLDGNYYIFRTIVREYDTSVVPNTVIGQTEKWAMWGTDKQGRTTGRIYLNYCPFCGTDLTTYARCP